MEEQSHDVEVGERAPCTNRLSCDILNSLAGVEADDFIFGSVQALDQNRDGQGWDLPNGICVLIIKLGGSVEQKLT